MENEMVCICCPMGCRMNVRSANGEITVEGNACVRGKNYAVGELTCPKRMVTGVVAALDGNLKSLSFKTSAPVPKNKIFDVLRAAEKVSAVAPVKPGDVLIQNVCGLNCDLIATKEVKKKTV